MNLSLQKAPTPSLPPYIGGRSKKRFTRKYPKNLVISH